MENYCKNSISTEVYGDDDDDDDGDGDGDDWNDHKVCLNWT